MLMKLLLLVTGDKVLRGDAADQVLEAQELESRLHHARSHVDHLRRNILADRSRHELHGTPSADADALHLLQLRLSHLLVDGLRAPRKSMCRHTSTVCSVCWWT